MSRLLDRLRNCIWIFNNDILFIVNRWVVQNPLKKDDLRWKYQPEILPK